MNDLIGNNEKLYRAIRNEYLKEGGKISSAAFSSINGCSVDIKGNRREEEVINFMKNSTKLEGSIARIISSDCYCDKVKAFIKYEPTKCNDYHAAIYKNDNLELLDKSQMKELANRCIIVQM